MEVNGQRIPVGIYKVSTQADLNAIPAISEHSYEDIGWTLLYEVDGQWCQEVFTGHPWVAIRETVQSRMILSTLPLVLLMVSALIIDVEAFNRTDFCDGIDLDVIAEVDSDITDDQIDLPSWFPERDPES